MAERRTRVLVVIFVGYCLLQVCGAGNITCTVTQGTDQTTYSVPDERTSDCSYSWANTSDTGHSVLAHEEEFMKNGPVRSANVSTFVTSECFPQVIYKRDCRSEDEVHTSNCTVVCREKFVLLEEIKKTTSRSWIIPVVVIIIIIIIIISFVIVLVGLIYFRPNRTCFYSPVNMKDVEAQAPVGQ